MADTEFVLMSKSTSI